MQFDSVNLESNSLTSFSGLTCLFNLKVCCSMMTMVKLLGWLT